MVDNPEHVKKLNLDQLEELAAELREELISKLAKHGGHLGPNLGVVELTIALHYVFSTPKDKFVWDVSHQSYVHKLLTGRKDRFHTIRQTDGLCGFALRSESEHDAYGAAHAGTALSAALGIAAARDARGSDEDVVAIFGDAALTNGISFEALNNVACTTKKFIGILNDNEWSIAKNVGAISSYLNKLIQSPSFNKLSKDFERWIKKLPKGEEAVWFGNKVEEAINGAVTTVSLNKQGGRDGDDFESEGKGGGFGNSLFFEEMGIRYIGPMDGHNLPLLISSLKFAKTCEEPVVLHLVTKKGKGFDAAQNHPEKFHGLGPYDAKTGETPKEKPGAAPKWQDVFGDTMVKLCKKDNSVVGITAAMPSGTGLKTLEEKMPDRYYDVGIAEEHAVIFAAGMASMGYHPVVAIYSTFLQRGYDCIIHDVALQELPVIFCMDRAGLSAQDGPTHHGLFDISFIRCVPKCIIMAPKDENELQDMMFTATHEKLPTFIRYPRGAAEGVEIAETPSLIEVGKSEVLENFSNNGGTKVAFFAMGNMNPVARTVAEALAKDGFDCALVNARFAKPLDEGTHEFFAQAADLIVTLEDHVVTGGYGAGVIEHFAEQGIHANVLRIGWPDEFIGHASSVKDLREQHGLTEPQIEERVRKHLESGAKIASIADAQAESA